jgi:FkbM family methyltransferase
MVTTHPEGTGSPGGEVNFPLVKKWGYEWYELLGEDSVVLDLGAHEGKFSSFILERYNCRVVAYDPATELKIDHPKFTFHKKAVWFTSPVGFNDTLGDANSILRVEGHTTQVRATPLDTILQQYPRVDILKVNVEGAEIPLLLYSQELHRVRQLLVGIHLWIGDQFDPPIIEEDKDRLLARMAGLGFTKKLIDPRHPDYLFYRDI